MKKLLYVCASLLCLAVGAAVLLVSVAAGLRLLREPVAVKEGAAANAVAPIPVSAVSSGDAVKGAPAVSFGFRVYTVDFDKVMRDSVPGRAVNNYARKYEAVMGQNIEKLNAALADKKKRYDVPAVKRMIAQFTKQKSDVWTDARNIIRGLIRTAVAPSPLKDALLIDSGNVLNLPQGLDKTDALIGYIDRLKLNLPAPPQPIEIK